MEMAGFKWAPEMDPVVAMAKVTAMDQTAAMAKRDPKPPSKIADMTAPVPIWVMRKVPIASAASCLHNLGSLAEVRGSLGSDSAASVESESEAAWTRTAELVGREVVAEIVARTFVLGLLCMENA